MSTTAKPLIQVSSLFDVARVIRSDNAPTETRMFHNGERVVKFKVRLGFCWNKKECEQVVNRLLREVRDNETEENRARVNSLLLESSYQTKLAVLKNICRAHHSLETLKEYAPVLLTKEPN